MKLIAKFTGWQIILFVLICFTACDRNELIEFVHIPATGITLNINSGTVFTGGTEQLIAAVVPADATNTSITWHSNNDTIATVSQNGLVTGNSPGITSIEAITADGGHQAVFEVTVVLDTDPPVPGDSGIILTGSITNNSLTLTWTSATDNATPRDDLKYAVYQSGTDNINTVLNCELNGTLIQNYTKNLTSLNVSGLMDETDYFFNVIAIDTTGNKSLYIAKYEATTAPAGVWIERTSSGLRRWLGLACSTDGKKIAAVNYGGYIYTSDNGGKTWNERISAGSRNWGAISSSDDGMELFSIVNGGYAYTSIDGGTTWTQRNASRWWSNVFSSSDGSLLYGTAESFGNIIHKSDDSGATWSTINIAGADYVARIRGSSDGIKLISSEYNGYVYTSIDAGANWTRRDSLGSGICQVVSSGDANTLMAAQKNGNIHVSTNGGDSWAALPSPGVKAWIRASISADGGKMAAVEENGYIYTSFDGGVSWVEQTSAGQKAWSAIELSKDGTRITASVDNGYIYTYIIP